MPNRYTPRPHAPTSAVLAAFTIVLFMIFSVLVYTCFVQKASYKAEHPTLEQFRKDQSTVLFAQSENVAASVKETPTQNQDEKIGQLSEYGRTIARENPQQRHHAQIIRRDKLIHQKLIALSSQRNHTKTGDPFIIKYFGNNPLPFGLPLTNDILHPILKSRNLILGLASNVDVKNLAIFCGSFEAHIGSDASVVLFIDYPVSPMHSKLLSNYPHIYPIPYKKDSIFPISSRNYHPSSLRWIFYHRFLQLYIQDPALTNSKRVFMWSMFDKIIVLDIRDSAFQANPFQLIQNGNKVLEDVVNREPDITTVDISDKYQSFAHTGLQVFGENLNSPIQRCSWNSGWIEDCFGTQLLQTIGMQPIICSGVSMGSSNDVQSYVTLMHDILLGQSRASSSPLPNHFPMCERNGVDQGVHNVLIHKGLLPGVKVHYPQDYPMVNLQSALSTLIIDQKNPKPLMMPYPHKNVPYAIVHQYDRHQPLQIALAQEYIDWIPWHDLSLHWKQSPMCQNLNYVADIDLFRGLCDIRGVRIMTAASCCEYCQQQFNPNMVYPSQMNPKVCTGFTFAQGVCYLKSCTVQEVRAQLQYTRDKTKEMQMMEKGARSAYIRFPL